MKSKKPVQYMQIASVKIWKYNFSGNWFENKKRVVFRFMFNSQLILQACSLKAKISIAYVISELCCNLGRRTTKE